MAAELHEVAAGAELEVVAELVTRAPARPRRPGGGDAVVAELAAVAKR